MVNLKSDFEIGDLALINFINLREERELVRNWRNIEEVRRWMFSDHIISKEEHAEFLKTLERDDKNYYWLIKDKKGGNIGVISLNRIDLKNSNAYLGIYVSPDYRVPGAGGLLINLLKHLSFRIVNLHTLRLEVIDGNERAISFYKRSGFDEEGRLKEFVFKEGQWRDVIIMGIIKKEDRLP